MKLKACATGIKLPLLLSREAQESPDPFILYSLWTLLSSSGLVVKNLPAM